MTTNQAAWDERMLIAEERLIQQLIDEQDALISSSKDYDIWHDKHFPRIRKILEDSGDYEWNDFTNDPDYRDRVLDTDTHIIMDVPHLNPEFFT